ncbi:MAG TPA: MBL fold metallo-hydrolase [Rhodobacteraceae bacterium]|jgi:glyoxylase-like metal-dependent hydrolase (beta-lactamase superfamily II)|nr:MBL fold metallo-hydrolase [Paracoccaceae bacterium]
MPFKTFQISDGVSLIQETGVANFMRCNIWHIKGRDFDLVVDTGMGLSPLKAHIVAATEKPLKALVTHCHFDHSGGLHEFDCRLGHRAEADILANPANEAVVYGGGWTKIEIVDPKAHPEYRPETYSITPAPLTGHLDEGDLIDLGDRAFQVLHLPGHSPGSIGLWDVKSKTLFSGDAVYDGELLDGLYHSDKAIYAHTLSRIRNLGAEVFHAGHYPSFGQAQMTTLIDTYMAGNNTLSDPVAWFNDKKEKSTDMFADQDWSGAAHG